MNLYVKICLYAFDDGEFAQMAVPVKTNAAEAEYLPVKKCPNAADTGGLVKNEKPSFHMTV